MTGNEKRITSQVEKSLNNRIDTNEKLGNMDLNGWIVNFVKPLKDKKILDIGCGTGKQIEAFIPEIDKKGEILGLDLSDECIAAVKSKIGESDPRIKVFVEDMLKLGAHAQKDYFDIAISTYALYYSNDVEKTLRDMKNALKSDGKLVVVGPHGDNNKEFFDLIDFMTLPPRVLNSTTTFMNDTVLPFCRNHFTDVKIDYFINKVVFSDKQSLIDYWKSNIYYEEKYDTLFNERVNKHFETNNEFIVHKKAMGVSASVKK